MANGSLAVGVTLCFIGNVTINVGTILMKIGHNHHAEAMSAKKGKTKIYEHKVCAPSQRQKPSAVTQLLFIS
jgi:hypothetical protein